MWNGFLFRAKNRENQALQGEQSLTCRSCKRSIAPDYLFCPYCGERQNGEDNLPSNTADQKLESGTMNDAEPDMQCYGCGKKLPKNAKECPACGKSFAVTEDEKRLAAQKDLIICRNCRTLNAEGASFAGGTGKPWMFETSECCKCGIKIAFPISDTQRQAVSRLYSVRNNHSTPKMQYLAMQGKEQLANQFFTLRILCVYNDHHFTLMAKGMESQDDVINRLEKAGYFEPDIRFFLPYFSNWPATENEVAKPFLRQTSCLVCELPDIELELHSKRKGAARTGGVLYGCPRPRGLEDNSILNSVQTEVVSYGE